MLRCPALTMSCKDKDEYSLHAGCLRSPLCLAHSEPSDHACNLSQHRIQWLAASGQCKSLLSVLHLMSGPEMRLQMVFKGWFAVTATRRLTWRLSSPYQML